MARSDASRSASSLSRLQAALIAFFAGSAAILVAVYAVAPTAFADIVPLDRQTLARHPPILTLFVGAVLALIAVAIIGIARRWRWLFWPLLVACASAVLHLPVTLLQLAGILAGGPPCWYALLQLGSEVAQIALALGMVRSFRRDGARVVGRFGSRTPRGTGAGADSVENDAGRTAGVGVDDQGEK